MICVVINNNKYTCFKLFGPKRKLGPVVWRGTIFFAVNSIPTDQNLNVKRIQLVFGKVLLLV